MAQFRGHPITDILQQLSPAVTAPVEILEASRELDKVYVTSRSPNGFISGTPSDYFTEKGSGKLISHARDILEFCRSQIH